VTALQEHHKRFGGKARVTRLTVVLVLALGVLYAIASIMDYYSYTVGGHALSPAVSIVGVIVVIAYVNALRKKQ
jgi:hypothetical protein